ncbi:hypothetical protein SDRG_13100 [Saprolegnia diclina VS20]|uniref:RanBP2-type domain-containing protein n=1 Tax=Saprolegnia diclina (strain VS20) TaxID=1156394 RepID=T0RHD4_SAPDV|nr:hypothetical protein SDRG_13100 [Saprolegnia diclina VS20]EQC29227.1 hypothetical protein SDRG_13100 [Saprolegnia diclina VS20]|eukprot:XP_008617405.1 hypothetical protein SDRG_13100 [Saprolegnia diclina VS20]
MSCWRIADEMPTKLVVTAAIERFANGPANPAQVERITTYLADRNWFTHAADLRVAIANEAQWKLMELPIRLKLALEEVLGEWDTLQPAPETSSIGVPVAQAVANGSYSASYAWVCVSCGTENQFEDSFCVTCCEHYSISVPDAGAPSAPEFDASMAVPLDVGCSAADLPTPYIASSAMPLPPAPAEYY